MKDWQLDGIKLDEAHDRSPPVTPALEMCSWNGDIGR